MAGRVLFNPGLFQRFSRRGRRVGGGLFSGQGVVAGCVQGFGLGQVGFQHSRLRFLG